MPNYTRKHRAFDKNVHGYEKTLGRERRRIKKIRKQIAESNWYWGDAERQRAYKKIADIRKIIRRIKEPRIKG